MIPHRPEILVVEDDPAVRNLIEIVLSRVGLDVDLAVDGMEAVEAIERRDYPLIFLDLSLPRLDGFSFLRVLGDRVDGKRERPVVVVVSAHPLLDELDFDRSLVPVRLKKPFEPEALQNVALGYLKASGSPPAAKLKIEN